MRIELESTQIDTIAEQIAGKLSRVSCYLELFVEEIEVFGINFTVTGNYSLSYNMADVSYGEEPYAKSIDSRCDVSDIAISVNETDEMQEEVRVNYKNIIIQLERKVEQILEELS